MLRAYKYRLYPNKQQAELLVRQLGACRFVFNLALETKMYAWQTHQKNISAYELHKQLTELRKDHKWLQESSRDALEKSILNLEKGYKSFLASIYLINLRHNDTTKIHSEIFQRERK